MIALLLAAGLGERLRPITNNIPKCLVPIGGRPLLDFWIENMISINASKIIINTHYHANVVHEFVEQHQYKDKIEILFEPKLVGTGGTLRNTAENIKNQDVLLAHADNFCPLPMNDFINHFETRDNEIEITMMTFRTETPASCGIVEIDDGGIVQKFHEKVSNPPSNLASGAVFLLSNDTVQFVRKQKPVHLDFSKDILPHYMGRINTWENKVYHRDIGTPESYLQCLKDWENLQNRVI
jgi:mannose-1-phosphate guanylyltransferase